MADTIVLTLSGAVASLTLNRGARHNSLGRVELQAIQDCLDQVEQNNACRALIVANAGGKTFCAGADIDELNSGEISGDLFQQATDRIAALSIPTIAVVNGSVYGGGVELALSCDYRIGVPGVTMRVPAATIGLCYPIAGIRRFVNRLGVAATKRILMAAEEFSSEEMKAIGFLDYVVETVDLADKVTEMSENLAKLAPLSVSAMKYIIDGCADGSLNQKRSEERAFQCLESLDLKEGFIAKKEKREPRFAGR